MFNRKLAVQLDKLVLYMINRYLPASFEESYRSAPALETVLEETAVNWEKTAVSPLSAPGEHPIWLNTSGGELQCHVRARPAASPQAPLVLYHHGFNELPYAHSWRRIFRHPSLSGVHAVCVQAPFHESWMTPITRGLATVQNAYQIFAGSLRMMELMQSHFEGLGAAYTVVAGVSWGGVTSMLYEGLFQRSRAVIPLLSSPNLGQVMWDIAHLFNRPLSVSRNELMRLFDFTNYYRLCEPKRVFPLLGEHDYFFRLEHHADLFAAGLAGERPFVTIPDGHITGHMKIAPLRRHIHHVLSRVAKQTSQEPLKFNSG